MPSSRNTQRSQKSYDREDPLSSTRMVGIMMIALAAAAAADIALALRF